MATAVKLPWKFPPPCWTRDEALFLIAAYSERWHALHRAFPGGRFFSSWFYFEAMEAMENGPGSERGNDSPTRVSDLQSLNPGRGIRFKPASVQNLVTLAASSINHTPNFDSRVSNHNSSHMNNWSNQEEEENEKYKSAKGGIRIKPSIPSQPRKFSKAVDKHEADEDGELWIKVPKNGNSWNPNLDQGKRRGSGNGGIQEVVSSIKLLGDGFMKMEKMKIDMAKEIERMRMEAEMKRNQLILESQKQIVDVLLKGLVGSRRLPIKTETICD